jgi:hypothetical protein
MLRELLQVTEKKTQKVTEMERRKGMEKEKRTGTRTRTATATAREKGTAGRGYLPMSRDRRCIRRSRSGALNNGHAAFANPAVQEVLRRNPERRCR